MRQGVVAVLLHPAHVHHEAHVVDGDGRLRCSSRGPPPRPAATAERQPLVFGRHGAVQRQHPVAVQAAADSGDRTSMSCTVVISFMPGRNTKMAFALPPSSSSSTPPPPPFARWWCAISGAELGTLLNRSSRSPTCVPPGA